MISIVTSARRVLTDLLSDESGATAVEYGVMIAAIIAVVIVLVFSIGQNLIPGFETVNSNI